MINIKEEKDILIKEEDIVLTPSYKELYYKEKFLKNNYKITTISNFLINNYNGDKKLSTKFEDLIIMYATLKKVSGSLSYFKEINDPFFIKELLNTYDDFKNYTLIDNEKTNDLTIIYNEYENMLLQKGLINNYLLLNEFVDNKTLDKNYIFLGFSNFSEEELKLINILSLNGNVTIFISPSNFIIRQKLSGLKSNVDVKETLLSKKYILYKGLNDLSDEVKFIDNDISKKIMDGACYDDFLIASESIESYYPYFDILLNHPYSKKTNKGILTNRFLNLFLQILKGDFSCNLFINILKLGVFEIDLKKVDIIDNYIYGYDLYEESFYVPFKYNPTIGKNYFSKEDEIVLEEINDTKNNIINPIKYLIENVINAKDKKEILRYLYTYLSEEKIIEKLFEKDEYGCNILINLFDIINNNLDCEVSFSEVINIFDMFDLTITEENNMQDSIIISNLENISYEDKKYVYLIGATNDDLPKEFKLNGLLNKDDLTKDNLIKKLKEYYEFKSYLFDKLINEKEVIVTYPKLGVDLKLKKPSLYLEELDKKEVLHDKLYNKNLILNDYSINLANKKMRMQTRDIFSNINNSNIHNLSFNITKDNASMLYKSNLNLTPSKIEVYSKCPFYFFCEYGLKLKIKEKRVFDNRELGSLVHFILEKIIKNNLDEVRIDNLEEYVLKYAYLYLEENKKVINNTIKFVIKKVCESTTLVIKNIIEEQKISKFKPKYFEFKINEESIIKPFVIPLENGTLSISGVVDRVDVYEDDSNYYYRIIDYKTGDKKFRLDDILISLNLQMLLYLLILKKNSNLLTDKKVIPSALLYYPALVKESISSRKLTNKEKEESITEKLKMNGIVCNMPNVISNMGDCNIGKYISITSRGKLNEENLYGLDELELIFNSIKKSLKEIGNNILNGNINVNPTGGRNDACTYCKYSSICKFDFLIDKKKKTYNLKNKEVIKMLEGDKNA